MRSCCRFMFSFWEYFVPSPASEQGGPVLPETLGPATVTRTDPEVEPGSESSSSKNPLSEGPMSLQFNSTTTGGSSSSEASTGTNGLAAFVSPSLTEQTISDTSTARPPAQDSPHELLGEDKDCVYFDSHSYVGSSTINFDSKDATGPRYSTPKNRFRLQQPPSPVAYSSQITRPRKWERVTYFGPGTVVDGATVNIRSERASGAVFGVEVVPSRTSRY